MKAPVYLFHPKFVSFLTVLAPRAERLIPHHWENNLGISIHIFQELLLGKQTFLLLASLEAFQSILEGSLESP